jgi:hypothetical protein
MLDEHVYYWAWQEKDNEDYDFNEAEVVPSVQSYTKPCT